MNTPQKTKTKTKTKPNILRILKNVEHSIIGNNPGNNSSVEPPPPPRTLMNLRNYLYIILFMCIVVGVLMYILFIFKRHR